MPHKLPGHPKLPGPPGQAGVQRASDPPVLNPNDDLSAGSLRQVINSAPSGSTITFSSNILPAVITLDPAKGPIVIDKNLTIDGPGLELLTISGSNQTAIFTITGGAVVTIQDISFVNGSANQGGAIGVFSSTTLNVQRCSFTSNNATDFGGAIANGSSGTVNVSNSTFTDNHGNFSGAIGNGRNGTFNITRCTFTNNSVNRNGGAFANDGTASITNCMFFYNSATSGGAFANDGTASISNCTFSYNSVSNNGGAIANFQNGDRGTVTITKSTFSFNSASNFGGAFSNESTATINNSSFTATISNSTFSTNTASNGGGAIANLAAGNVDVSSSKFSGNTPADFFGDHISKNRLTFS